jgi:site-specific recombinase XerD
VGVRGFTVEGLPDPQFRGRWAARNAVFCDLMVRTGLRLAEQAALTVQEVPLTREGVGYQRFWLPEAIAKGTSARWVYVPESVVPELASYVAIDRPEVIEAARAAGRYQHLPQAWIVDDSRGTSAVRVQRSGVMRRVKVAHLQ